MNHLKGYIKLVELLFKNDLNEEDNKLRSSFILNLRKEKDVLKAIVRTNSSAEEQLPLKE